MLYLDMKMGDTLKVGGKAEIKLAKKSGTSIRLEIQAERSIPVEMVRRLTVGVRHQNN